MEEYIKCEQIGGVSPRHLNNFSNFFYCSDTIVYSLINNI